MEDKPMIEEAQKVLLRNEVKLVNFSGGDAASARVRRALGGVAAGEEVELAGV
nr:hypothetical protein [Sphingomonas sp.]